MCLGLPVSGTIAGLDRVAQMLFDIVGDRYLYQNEK